MMPEQSTLGIADIKAPVVKVIVDFFSCKMCIVFPETGAMACVPFKSWEHMKRSERRDVKQAHHKLTVLVPEESVIIANGKGDLRRILEELVKKEKELKEGDREYTVRIHHCSAQIVFGKDEKEAIAQFLKRLSEDPELAEIVVEGGELVPHTDTKEESQ